MSVSIDVDGDGVDNTNNFRFCIFGLSTTVTPSTLSTPEACVESGVQFAILILVEGERLGGAGREAFSNKDFLSTLRCPI